MNPRLAGWHLLTQALFREKSLGLPDRSRGLEDLSLDQWRTVLYLSNIHLVTPALWPIFNRAGVTADIPLEVRRYLRTNHELNVARNRRLGEQLDEAIVALNQNDIVPTLLKGAAYLKAEIHSDIGVRFMSDLDILVPAAQLGRAESTLRELGYRTARNHTAAAYRNHHHLQPLSREGTEAAIEIHRSALCERASQLLPTRALFSNSTESLSSDLRYRQISRDHTAMLSFLHTQITDQYLNAFIIGLRPLHDMVAMHAAWGNSINWSGIHEHFRKFGGAGVFRRHLYSVYRLADLRPLPELSFSMTDRIHYAFCEMLIGKQRLRKWVERTQQFSARKIEKRYSITHGWRDLNRARLHHALHMLARWTRTRLGLSS